MQNYSIKSGGNAIHGSLYEYNRNTLFDAWPFTSKVPTLRRAKGVTVKRIKPREIQNEFGIVISGPIIKNKLFLFGNYGQYREQNGATYHGHDHSNLGDAGPWHNSRNGVADFTRLCRRRTRLGLHSLPRKAPVAATAHGCDDIYDPSTATWAARHRCNPAPAPRSAM